MTSLSRLFCFLFFCASFSHLNAQTIPAPCGTDVDRLLQSPEYYQAYRAFQQRMANFSPPAVDQSNKTSENPNASRYVIPCVVHVVYAKDEDSLRYNQIYSGFQSLYNDFRRVPHTRGFGGSMVDSKIEFVLASVDPSGKPTSAINYYRVPEADTRLSINEDNEKLKLEIAPAWDTKRYFNIWLVVATREGNTGYAQFPWTYDIGKGNLTDGVVCFQSTWGTTGSAPTYHYTPTHEIGHWLNLLHTFQGSCGNSECRRSGDNICDTPPMNLANGFGDQADERNNSCREEPYDKPDASLNYMNYNFPSNSPNFFSPEQVSVFHTLLENPEVAHRYLHWQPQNLQRTGAGKNMKPNANFWTNERNACINQPVSFLDFTFGLPNRWEWAFEGATPATSTAANPTVSYSQAGKYSVSLKVWNESGQVDSLTKLAFITVENPTQSAITVSAEKPFTYNFNTITANNFPPTGWYIENLDSSYRTSRTWAVTKRYNGFNRTESDGTGVIWFRHFNHNQYNQRDAFVMPVLQPQNMNRLTLHFDMAYSALAFSDARRSNALVTEYTDSLAVYVSSGCNNDWTKIWQRGGRQLQTVPRASRSNANGEGGEFTEISASQWKTIGINLPESWTKAPSIRFKFETISGFGNNLMIDNIKIDTTLMTGISDVFSANNFELYPNPTNDQVTFGFHAPSRGTFSWQLLDVTGRVISEKTHQEIQHSWYEESLSLRQLSEGVYFLKMQFNDQSYTQKIVRY